MTQEEIARQIYMMQTPKGWKRYPFLPLHKQTPGKEEELGFLYLMPDGPSALRLMPTVYFGNIFRIIEGSKYAAIDYLNFEEVKALSSRTYPTFASIVYDGWTVDD